ncbi:hypothetical protein LCGC14_2435060 [marine sediment metagenome]|uniref:Uncharacterized protein n=1 Tax=marine sediment metagenome TaxID=412755 RepID=A0A0F9BKW2_9ZZZZ
MARKIEVLAALTDIVTAIEQSARVRFTLSNGAQIDFQFDNDGYLVCHTIDGKIRITPVASNALILEGEKP